MNVKVNWLRVFLGAIAYLVIAQVLHTVSSMLTMNYYIDASYFAVWSKVMMSAAGPPSMEFYYYSLAFSLIIGLIYSYIYTEIKNFMKGTVVKKGLKYGFAIFLIAGIPFFLSNYLLINLPLNLLVYWLVFDGLLTYLLGGIAIAWLNK
jgi:hypothetical protein